MAGYSTSGMDLPPHTHQHEPIGPHFSTGAGEETVPPNHLGTNVPTGDLGSNATSESTNNNGIDPEKAGHHHTEVPPPPDSKQEGVPVEEDDNIDDIDALIDDLESQDGGPEEEEEITEVGGARPVSEDLLQTDTRRGLSEQEVIARRKKFGPNQMKEEKENLILKFLMYFVGPIQFVMEVNSFFISFAFANYRARLCIPPSSMV